jgi:hypothetical protein
MQGVLSVGHAADARVSICWSVGMMSSSSITWGRGMQRDGRLGDWMKRGREVLPWPALRLFHDVFYVPLPLQRWMRKRLRMRQRFLEALIF